jgi:nucleoid DNA-binding protein
MSKPATVNRREFISRFMRDCGMSYVQACQVFDTMVSVVEDGVCSGAKIRIGKVGAIVPKRLPPRSVSQNVEMGAGRTPIKTQKIIHLGPRLRYSFKLYRQFMETHSLKWFEEA